MSRPHENRVRVVCHVLPVADARLRKLAIVHGTLGRAVDALVGVGGKTPRAKSRAKTHNEPKLSDESRAGGTP